MNEIAHFYSESIFHEVNSLYHTRSKEISFLKQQRALSLSLKNITITIYFLFGRLNILKKTPYVEN